MRNVQLKKTIESHNQIDLFAQEKDFFEQISQRPNIPEIDKFYLSDKIIQRYISTFIFERLVFYSSSLTLPWQTYQFQVEQFSIKQRNNDRILSPQFQLSYNQYWILIIYPVHFLFCC